MSPSTKKRPRNRVVSKMQDKKLQDKINQPISKRIERSRLKMVLKHLSLLKLLKRSNSRIQELHTLARRCWNTMLKVPNMLQNSRDNVCKKAKQNNEELQEIRAHEKKPEFKKTESLRVPKEKLFKEWNPKEWSKGSPATVPRRKAQKKSKALKTLTSRGLNTRDQKRKPHVKKPRVVFLKTYHRRNPKGIMKALDGTDHLVWFEGLPTHVRLPGRRIMCRSSALRCVKRACTRFCSVSL